MALHSLTRRQALGLLAAPFTLPLLSACGTDRLLSPLLNASSSDPITFLAAGDLHTRTGLNHGSRKVASLVRSIPDVPFFAIGDLGRDDGSAAAFADFRTVWEEFFPRMWGSLGNHDRKNPDGTFEKTAREYYRTFLGLDEDPTNDRAGAFGAGYYAMTFGTWRIYVLNSEHDQDYQNITATGEQAQWLAADLAAHINYNKGALWHKPRFVSTGNNPGPSAYCKHFWNLLQQHRADWVITGHTHRYERMGRANQDGSANPLGLRQFIVGTGGAPPVYITSLHPRSESQHLARGVLRMTLLPNHYAWEFIDTAGLILDQGSEASLVTVESPPPDSTAAPAA